MSHFLQDLTNRSTVTRAECLLVVGFLIQGRHAFDQRSDLAKTLTKRGIARECDADFPSRNATRGYACLLFRRAMEDEGGVLSRILKHSEHLAYRHLEYLNMIPTGGSAVNISGPELLSLLSLSKKRLTESPARSRSSP